MSSKIRATLTAAALVALCGCQVVVSTHPVGREPVKLDPDEWDGTWLGDDGAVVLTVVDSERGLLRIAWIEDGDEEPELESHLAYVRSFADASFGSVQAEEEGKGRRYVWARIAKDGERILSWTPDAEKIAALVEKGILPGTVGEDGEVTLTELQETHLVILTSETHGVLFEWKEPGLLRRVASP